MCNEWPVAIRRKSDRTSTGFILVSNDRKPGNRYKGNHPPSTHQRLPGCRAWRIAPRWPTVLNGRQWAGRGNRLAIRIDLGGSPSFTTLLRRIRQRVFGALAHQEVPFEQVVQELQVPRDLGRTAVFQVVFALQSYESATGAWPENLQADWFHVALN